MAIGVRIEGPDYTCTREREILRRYAARSPQAVEGRCIVPSVALERREWFSNSLIVKEEEDLIFPDRTADAAAELIELIVVSLIGKQIAIERLVGVQVRLVSGVKEAAVEVISATLRSDLNLRPTEAAILGVIAI